MLFYNVCSCRYGQFKKRVVLVGFAIWILLRFALNFHFFVPWFYAFVYWSHCLLNNRRNLKKCPCSIFDYLSRSKISSPWMSSLYHSIEHFHMMAMDSMLLENQWVETLTYHHHPILGSSSIHPKVLQEWACL